MAPSTRSSRRPVAWVLVLAFIVVPLMEIYLLIQVGQVIGGWWTIGLLITASVVGGWLVKREGGRAWAALRTALAAGRMPSRELADAALILIGGTLMLTPGFLSDIVGLAFVLPVTRPVARRWLTRIIAGRALASASRGPRPGLGNDRVVRGDVVED